MDLKTNKDSKKIKRRNFFYYIGASAIGGFLFSKFPFKIFSDNKKHIIRSSNIKVEENPFAVKRESRRGLNG